MKARYFLFILGSIIGMFGIGATEQNQNWDLGVPLMVISLVILIMSVIIPSNINVKSGI